MNDAAMFEMRVIVAPKYVYTAEDLSKIEDIVLSIINGLSIKQIEPVLYPAIERELIYQKTLFEDEGNKSARRQIKKSLAEIQAFYEQKETKKEKNRTKARFKIFEDDKLDSIVEDLIRCKPVNLENYSEKGNQKIDKELISSLLEKLNERKNAATALNCIDEAKKAQSVIFRINNYINDVHAKEEQEKLDEEMREKRRHYEKEMIKKENEWNKQISNIEEERNLSLRVIEEQQAAAIRRFEKIYNKEKKPPFKCSKKLTLMKKKMQELTSNNYSPGKNTLGRDIADLEMSEREEYEDMLSNDYERRLNAIRKSFENKYNEKVAIYGKILKKLRTDKENEMEIQRRGLEYLSKKTPSEPNGTLFRRRRGRKIPFEDEMERKEEKKRLANNKSYDLFKITKPMSPRLSIPSRRISTAYPGGKRGNRSPYHPRSTPITPRR